ncbi:hypothetical protein CL655_04070 [bacterium]|nr:hypothetical protein [bacterium]|tara:strand:- start:25 stop:633 length:609 start_codon:yes stop_codon:yes gene_type:complete
MSKRDWFLFISTFIVAVLCGMWLYFTTFVPTYVANPTVQEIAEQVAPEWTVSVRVYGGCAMAGVCPAYELTSRGAYRYQPEPDAALETGSLPPQLTTEYNELVTSEALAAQTALVTGKSCRSFADGLDYTVLLTTSAESYELDTCRTALSYESGTVALVRETLSYLDNPGTYQPPATQSTGRRGLGGYIERKLDETFDYDDN